MSEPMARAAGAYASHLRRSSAIGRGLVRVTSLLAMLLALLLQPAAVAAWSRGAPVTQCDALLPPLLTNRHDNGAYQTTPSPFTLALGASSYEAGSESALVPVTISAPVDDHFGGFMVSAYKVNEAGQPVLERLGSFLADEAAGTSNETAHGICPELNSGQAMIQGNKLARTSVHLLWQPPTVPGSGTAMFMAMAMRPGGRVYWALDTVSLTEVMPATPPNPTAVSVVNAQLDPLAGTSALTIRVVMPASPAQVSVGRLLVEVAMGDAPFVAYANFTVRASDATVFTHVLEDLPPATNVVIRVRSESSRPARVPGPIDTAPTVTIRTASSADPLPPTPQVPAESEAPPLSQPGAELVLSLDAFAPATSAEGFLGFEVQTKVEETASPASRAARMRRAAAAGAEFTDDDRVDFVPAGETSFSLGTPVVGMTYHVRVRSVSLRGASAYSSPMSLAVTSLCLNSCNGRGQCMSPDNVCNCDAGWLGADCSLPSRIGHHESRSGGLYCLLDSTFCMDFAFDPSLPASHPLHNVATFRMTVRSMGYAGYIFDAPDGMTGGYGYMMTHRPAPGSAVAPGSSAVTTIYSPGLYDPVSAQSQDESVASSLRTWANATHVEYVFNKAVEVVPTLLTADSGLQHVAWAYGQQEADDHYGNCGKLQINFVEGRIVVIGGVEYEKMYAGMIAAFLAAIIFGGLFAHNTRWRFSAVGSYMLQDRLGTWKADNGRGWHRFFLDLVPTLEDLLWGELALALVWAGGFIAFIVVGYAKFEDVGKDGSLTWGHIAVVHYAFVLLPVNKNSVCAWIFQSSFERLIRFHRWLGRLALIFNWIHMIQMMAVRGARIAIEPDINLWGLVATIAFSVTMLIAWEPIRRRFWRLFIAVHLLCTPVGFVFACMHTKYMWWLCIPSLSLWAIDLAIRYGRALLLNPATHVSARVIVEDMPNENPMAPPTKYARFITELTLDVKGFPRDMEPGSYAYVNVPSVSLLEYHPMSISNYPPQSKDPNAPTRITFHILDAGSNWTHSLRDMVAKEQAAASTKANKPGTPATGLTVRVDGPYGRAAVELHRFRTIVLIGGGIGITPLLSILDFLCQRLASGDVEYAGLNDVHLIWSTRLAASFDWSRELLRRTQTLAEVNGRIHLHLFLFSGPDPVPRVRTWAQRHAQKLKNREARRLADPNYERRARGVEMVSVIVDNAASGVLAAVASPLAAPSSSPPPVLGGLDVQASHTVVGAGKYAGGDLYPSPTNADQHLVRFHYEMSTDAPPAAAVDAASVHPSDPSEHSMSRFSDDDDEQGEEEWQPPVINALANFKTFFSELRDAAIKVDTTKLPPTHVARISGVHSQTVAVLACGPPGLVADCQKQANHRGFFFHKEQFTF